MKKKYRIKNWKEYNQALVRRGSTEFWIDEDVRLHWLAERTHENGSPRIYSDIAIETSLMVRKLFHLPLRALEGFLVSLFGVSLPVPDYTTVSRRGQTLGVTLKKTKKEKTIVIIDSTGVKVYGEGEWKVRQHGYSKRRTWRKVHVAIDEDGEIRAAEVTGKDTHDADVAKKLLDQETDLVDGFAADGAYDHAKIYTVLQTRGIQKILIPPRKDAKIWVHGNRKTPPHPRDENLRVIRKQGRDQWKTSSGYHVRSLVENTMFRLKTIFGARLFSRIWTNQVTEVKVMCQILNKMMTLGMPKSYVVEV